MSRPFLRILHFVPETYLLPEYRFHGSTKDIAARTQYFREREIDFFFVPVTSRAVGLSDALKGRGLVNATHVIVDVPIHGDDLSYIRKRWRYANLIFRSHNAQLPHRLDTLLAAQMSPTLAEYLPAAEQNIRVFAERDEAAATLADCILSIEPMHTVAGYWRRMGFRGELLSCPYFLPNAYLGTFSHRRAAGLENTVMCITSGHPGPLIYDLLLNFHIAVSHLQEVKPEWRFVVTGKPVGWLDSDARRAPRVEHLGMVQDPISIVEKSRALAVLSGLGWGFKTKILDGIVGGAWILVTQQLLDRLPDPVKPYCIVIDMQSATGLFDAITQIEHKSWPLGDPNATLRDEAYSALDTTILDTA